MIYERNARAYTNILPSEQVYKIFRTNLLRDSVFEKISLKKFKKGITILKIIYALPNSILYYFLNELTNFYFFQ